MGSPFVRIALALAVVALAACGSNEAPTTLVVTVAPEATTLGPEQHQYFAATVAGSSDPRVSWSVAEAGGGTVDGTGYYTAPATAGTFHVVATSVADARAVGRATVTVDAQLAVVSVVVYPLLTSLAGGHTKQFAATVTGTANKGVRWSVVEWNGGSVDALGLYVASNASGTYHVVATSIADGTKAAVATVQVTAAPAEVGVAVVPDAAAVALGQKQQFAAVVTGTDDGSVTWSVDETAGGTIDGDGLYTAPSQAGTFHLRATSVSDDTVSGTALVYVSAAPAPTVSVSPASATVPAGGAQQFLATVTGATATAVSWSVEEAAGGTITATGLYTAPAKAGTYHVRATSAVDGTALDRALVIVTAGPAIAVEVIPHSVTVIMGAKAQLNATVTGASIDAVSWKVDETNGGTVTATGLYTAPYVTGTYHVRATAAADSAASDAAEVVVTKPVVVAVSPATATVLISGTVQLGATVKGVTDARVTWKVIEAGGGTIDDTGLYSAPATAGAYHVVATSVADTTAFDTATIIVEARNPVWVMAYYSAWQTDHYPVGKIDLTALTHLTVVRVTPSADGTISQPDAGTNGSYTWMEPILAAAHGGGKKALLMVGGFGAGANFRSATNADNIATFVKSLVDSFLRPVAQGGLGFDGLDLRWDGMDPAGADGTQMAALATSLRTAMPGIILTLTTANAAHAWYGTTGAPLFDRINLLTMGMAANWPGWVSWHHSPLYGDGTGNPASVSRAVAAYLGAGVPAAKLAIGIGFFGSVWYGGVPPVTAPLQSVAATVSCDANNDDLNSYAYLMSTYYTAAARQWDDTAKMAYLSYPSGHGPLAATFVSYEDADSIAAKGAFVAAMNLGGTMVWNIAEGCTDAANGTNPPLTAVKAAFLQ